MVWDNPNEGTMTIEKEEPILSKGKVTGTSTSKNTSKTTYENLVFGLNILKEQIDKANKEITENNSLLEQLGPAKIMTPELVRLKAGIEEIGRLEQIKKAKAALVPAQKDLKESTEWFAARHAVLQSRPKPKLTDKEKAEDKEADLIDAETEVEIKKVQNEN